MERSIEQFLLRYDAESYIEDLHRLLFMDEKQAAGVTGHTTTLLNGGLDTMAMSSIIEPPVPEWEKTFMRTNDDKISKLRVCG